MPPLINGDVTKCGENLHPHETEKLLSARRAKMLRLVCSLIYSMRIAVHTGTKICLTLVDERLLTGDYLSPSKISPHFFIWSYQLTLLWCFHCRMQSTQKRNDCYKKQMNKKVAGRRVFPVYESMKSLSRKSSKWIRVTFCEISHQICFSKFELLCNAATVTIKPLFSKWLAFWCGAIV